MQALCCTGAAEMDQTLSLLSWEESWRTNCYGSVPKILTEVGDPERAWGAHAWSDPRHNADTKAHKSRGQWLLLSQGVHQEGGSGKAQKEVQMVPWVPPRSGGYMLETMILLQCNSYCISLGIPFPQLVPVSSAGSKHSILLLCQFLNRPSIFRL